ncbi:MAG: Crp/Fnr family transcriptional regulator [Gammaproteobacteria bacterium]
MTIDKLSDTGEHRLGEYLLVSDGTINNVVEKQFQSSFTGTDENKRIGELLVQEGILTQEELDNSIRQQRIARLAACPIFATLSSMDLAALSKFFTEVSYPPNETFIMQGEEDSSLFVIATGLVEVFHLDNAGNETSIAKVGPGEPIGEMGYFTGGVRTACVRTLETTHLLQAQYKDLTDYFENVPRVALAFTTVVEQRKKEMDQLISQSDDN